MDPDQLAFTLFSKVENYFIYVFIVGGGGQYI